MNTTKAPIIIAWLFCIANLSVFGQRTENIHFQSGGFSGSVALSVKKGYYFEPYFNASQASITIQSYENGKHDPILKEAGISFPYTMQKGAGFEFTADAVIAKRDIISGGWEFFESVPVSFSTNDVVGSGQTFPPFSDAAKEWLKNKGSDKSIVGKEMSGGEAIWDTYGKIENIKTSRVYLTSFKTEVEHIISQHQSKEKERANRFETLVSKAKTFASGNNFEEARKTLAEAENMMEGQAEQNTVSDAKSFIDDKEREKEEQDKKEAEEKEKQEAEEKEKQEKAEQEKAEQENQEDEAKEAENASGGSSGSSGNSAAKGEKSDKESDNKQEADKDEKPDKARKIHIPKTNRQLYDELKALTDANPGMLNDPNIRARLRSYKAFADRDDRNMRDYQSFQMITGGGYHPTTAQFLASSTITNAKIANAEVAVGAAVDAATGLVNSIIEANNRKNEARAAEEQNKRNAANAKKKAIAEWEDQLRENRETYEQETVDKIKQDFTLVATIGDEPITYETEEYKEGKTYWKGQTMITPREFVKKTATMKNTWGNGDKTYNLYIVEMNGLYGILGDDGEALYPPQFEGIYALENIGHRPRFLVNIKESWGEIMADGSIAEDIKYDGIWYSPDKKQKILKYDEAWTIASLDNSSEQTYRPEQIEAAYPAGLVPVINPLRKTYNVSGDYSLSANGHVYVWGESTEEGVRSIPYESVKITQTTERMFKLDDKWYISMGFGTKSMKVDAMPRKFVVPTLREVETAQGKQRKWGAVNEKGETIIPFTYSYMAMEKQGITTNNGDFFGPQYQTKWLTENNLYYDNGQLKASRWFNEEDNVEGEVLMYHENGNLSARLHYVNGLLDGEKQQSYREDGSLHSVEDWKDDVREGKATYYFKGGEIGQEGHYEKDKKEGEWITYYDTGAVYKRGSYKNDLETGEWKIYNEDGTPQTTITYENGGITNIIEH